MCCNLDNQWQQIQYMKRCHCSKWIFIKTDFKALEEATRDFETSFISLLFENALFPRSWWRYNCDCFYFISINVMFLGHILQSELSYCHNFTGLLLDSQQHQIQTRVAVLTLPVQSFLWRWLSVCLTGVVLVSLRICMLLFMHKWWIEW